MLRKWQQLRTDKNKEVILIIEVLKFELIKSKLPFSDWDLKTDDTFICRFSAIIYHEGQKRLFPSRHLLGQS